MTQDLGFWKNLSDLLESFAKTLALILGGLWTYLAFIRQRLAFPRLDVTVVVQEASLAQSILIRANVTLRNSGSVVATSNRGEIRLRQIIPPPSDIEHAAAIGLDPVPTDCAQIEWPMLAGRKWTWKRGEFEIEPGESDSLCADFFVPRQVQVVEIYFFLVNARKKKRNIGWTVSCLHHLTNAGKSNGQEREKHNPEARSKAAGAEASTKPAAAEAATAATPKQDQKVGVSRVTPASTGRPASPSAR